MRAIFALIKCFILRGWKLQDAKSVAENANNILSLTQLHKEFWKKAGFKKEAAKNDRIIDLHYYGLIKTEN